MKLCGDLQLDVLHCLCGLGSDGASVMLGTRGGVSRLLKDKISFLVFNHCIAHRLALACGQAANEIPYLKNFKDIIDQIYRFYKYSPVRTARSRRFKMYLMILDLISLRLNMFVGFHMIELLVTSANASALY